MRPDVFPVLADLTEVRGRAAVAKAHGRRGIPSIEFGGDLVVVLVVDDGTSATWVDDDVLDTLPPDAFPRAIDNLRARTRTPLRLTRCSSLKVGPIRDRMPDGLLVRVPTRRTVLCSMNRPADIAFADHLARHLTEAAPKSGASVVSQDWLMGTPDGWAAREL